MKKAIVKIDDLKNSKTSQSGTIVYFDCLFVKGIVRSEKGILDLKKTIVKIEDLKKFKNLQKWEVF